MRHKLRLSGRVAGHIQVRKTFFFVISSQAHASYHVRLAVNVLGIQLSLEVRITALECRGTMVLGPYCSIVHDTAKVLELFRLSSGKLLRLRVATGKHLEHWWHNPRSLTTRRGRPGRDKCEWSPRGGATSCMTRRMQKFQHVRNDSSQFTACCNAPGSFWCIMQFPKGGCRVR
jgi:hypothetical protein